ncbi:MAG: methanogenesis marker 2 protein [Candidatus Methanolliviera sp. GoM_oil]|nr:MAG: methanogenesis marker 2 protein [Candidatus Methanolliviera sp. GoM_oil]
MNLKDLLHKIREFDGVKRKSDIGHIVEGFEEKEDFVIASFGEDAAVLDFGDDIILMSADGIWEKMIDADPYWAGYCSILVNIHDICAMGGTPLAMVNILAMKSKEFCMEALKGMQDAIKKFKVPIVGGHLHPNTSYNSLGITIVGRAEKDSVIYSHTANVGEDVVVGVDLNGRIYPTCSLCWDSVTLKDGETLKRQMESMRILGRRKLVTAGKDLSNPGMLGTLGMLLEVSGVGAIVDINDIPIPDGLEMEQWLKMYPGMGFVVTCKKKDTAEVITVFKDHLLDAKRIGEIIEGRKLIVQDGEETEILFDIEKDGITGIKAKK